MTYAGYIVLGLIVVGFLVNLTWRVLSNRQALPCPSWLGWMVELDNPFTRVNSAQFIVDHLGLEPGMKVLDAGCGPGRVTLPLTETVGPQGEVIALDVQDEMLARTRAKAEAAGLTNIRYLQAELGEGNPGTLTIVGLDGGDRERAEPLGGDRAADLPTPGLRGADRLP
jgi:SAM-dependent methyltransferase